MGNPILKGLPSPNPSLLGHSAGGVLPSGGFLDAINRAMHHGSAPPPAPGAVPPRAVGGMPPANATPIAGAPNAFQNAFTPRPLAPMPAGGLFGPVPPAAAGGAPPPGNVNMALAQAMARREGRY